MAAPTEKALYRERTTLLAGLIALLGAVIGVAALFLAANADWLKPVPELRELIRELGALLVATVTLAFLWDLAGRRAFLGELLALAGVAQDVKSAGLIGINPSFQTGIDWASMFNSVRHLDIFFAYGSTWRGTHIASLRALAAKDECRIRVVLPDPEDIALMQMLAARFSLDQTEVTRRIREATEDFTALFKGGAADFSLWHLPADPLFSFYRFDGRAIMALYVHQKGRQAVPTFVFEEGGSFYNFLRDEFEAFMRDGIAHQVYPAVAMREITH